MPAFVHHHQHPYPSTQQSLDPAVPCPAPIRLPPAPQLLANKLPEVQRTQHTLSAKIDTLYGNSAAQKAKLRALSDSSLELQGAHSPFAAPSTSRPASSSAASPSSASPSSASRSAASSASSPALSPTASLAAASASSPALSSAASTAAPTAAAAAPTSSVRRQPYVPFAAAAACPASSPAPRPASPFRLPGPLRLIQQLADTSLFESLLSLVLPDPSVLTTDVKPLGAASTTTPRPSSSPLRSSAATITSPAYNPLAAAAAAASSSSAAPVTLDGPLGFVLAYADMRVYEWMLSLLLPPKHSALGPTAARLPVYNPLAAAAASPAAATSSSAQPFSLDGPLGFILEYADKREYEWMLSLLLSEDSTAMALSSTPTTPVTTTTTFTTAASSPASTTASTTAATTTTTTTTTSTTTGPLFPVKATTTSCHVPAPYVPLAYYMLAAATKGASPYKQPYTVAVRS